MKDFLKRWQNDKKYQIKIKLFIYTFLVSVVSIYAISISNYNNIDNNSNDNSNNGGKNYTINLAKEYKYETNINIDDNKYQYYGEKKAGEKTIIRVINDNIDNYIFKNNEYYKEENGIYIKTTKNEIYDVIDESYINIDTINNYLSKAEKHSNQYIIYLKDIVLNHEGNDYFVIDIKNNEINIEYTPLMKILNSNINKCRVNIKIVEIE